MKFIRTGQSVVVELLDELLDVVLDVVELLDVEEVELLDDVLDVELVVDVLLVVEVVDIKTSLFHQSQCCIQQVLFRQSLLPEQLPLNEN